MVTVVTPDNLKTITEEGIESYKKLDMLVMGMIDAFKESGLNNEYIIYNLGNTYLRLLSDAQSKMVNWQEYKDRRIY